MKLIFTLVLCLSFISCSKVYELTQKNSVYLIPNLSEKLVEPRNIEWDVGKNQEVTISKGIRFASTIPRVSDKSIETLNNGFGIDSWLVRVNRTRRGSTQAIGYFFIHLHNITRNSKNYTINLYYHAASVSKRFRLFRCPAFNHRFELGSFEIESRSMPSNLDLVIRPVKKFPGQVPRLRFAPMVLSGGRSLVGVYTVDIAFYNSKSKMRFSEWHPMHNSLHVLGERAVQVPSCVGVREENIPLPESKMPNIRDLEIK